MSKIAVIGSGISGLSTAYVLVTKGFEVTLFAAEFPPNTTSNKAAAFWFPYHVRNDRRGIKWCRTSYERYMRLSADPSTGISTHRLVKLIREENKNAELTWIDHMPANSYRAMNKAELLPGYHLGFEAHVPLIETQLFLPWMMNFLKNKNVSFIQLEVKSLQELTGKYSWIVNCTGLGSRQLCNDESIYPVRGQVALIAPQPHMPIFLDNEQPMYIVPRKDATIIGGTYEEQVYDCSAEPATISRLYNQAIGLFPALKEFPVVGSWAGLRPFRNEVRLEKENNRNIIHNYGHAGSGFTLAWGCAEDVAALIN